jgi:hypothetical protein
MFYKKQYLKEIAIGSRLKTGSKGKDVTKVQEWLNLWRFVSPDWKRKVTIDADFGPQTSNAVKEFQEMHALTVNGIVNSLTFSKLCEPMEKAFTSIPLSDLRQLVVSGAFQHLQNSPTELNLNNEGPWVRAYMDGNEGKEWAWCMGFVQTILDQAFSALDKDYTELMPRTYSCDVVGEYGKQTGRLIRNKKIREDADLTGPGDIFLIVNKPWDWTHTGFILERKGDWFETIEGNTNDEGAREGFEVCKRSRNFMKYNIDVFKLQ